MTVVFFLLPFFLLAGVALQTAGLYLFAILLPAGHFYLASTARSRAFPFDSVARCLLVMFFVFGLANLLNIFLPRPERVADLVLKPEWTRWKMYDSHLSTAFCISGVVMYVISKLYHHDAQPAAAQRTPVAAESIYRAFVFGLALATLLFGFYFVRQHTTGLELRNKTGILLPEHRMSNGLYRVFGFYGHPLSVASVALAFFSFSWVQFWEWMRGTPMRGGTAEVPSPRLPRFLLLRGEKRLTALLAPALFGFLSLAYLGLTSMSGGRSALAVAALMFFLIPLCAPLSKGRADARFLVLTLGTAAGGVFVYTSGIWTRIAEVWQLIQSGLGVDRFSFWKVHARMWLDRPLVGQGGFWIDNLLREEYYKRLGLGALRDKFNAHNIYLETLASVGLLGALVIFICLLRINRTITVYGTTRPACALFGRGLFFAVIANLLHGLTQNTFFDSNVSLVYLALLWTCLWVCVAPDEKPLKTRMPQEFGTAGL